MSSFKDTSQEVFLFVSSTSGGNLGQRYLNLKPSIVAANATVFIYDIVAEAKRSRGGFERVIERAELSLAASWGIERKPRVIACGGDGTVSWMCDEVRRRIQQYFADSGQALCQDLLNQLLFGVLPLGTGNDFSRTFGWGGHPPSEFSGGQGDFGFFGLASGLSDDEVTRISLGKSVASWLRAEVRRHDLWAVEVETEDCGDIFFVVECKVTAASESGKLSARHSIKISKKPGTKATFMCMRKCLMNYFSFGYESKVGMEFEKHRTGNAHLNQMVYGFQGISEACKANLGGNTAAKVGDVLQEMAVVDTIESGAIQRRNVIVTTLDEAHARLRRLPNFQDNPVNLLLLNTKTIVKGKDIWGGTDGVLCVDSQHIKYHHAEAMATVIATRTRKDVSSSTPVETILEVEKPPQDLATKSQELGDQKVYCVTYEDIASFVSDIATAELFGRKPQHGQRLWYGPDVRNKRSTYNHPPNDLSLSNIKDQSYIELKFKPPRRSLADLSDQVIDAKTGKFRIPFFSEENSAEEQIRDGAEEISFGDANTRIQSLLKKFPKERDYLVALLQEALHQYPQYRNDKDAVFMQIDGEYFAVKWPKIVRVVYDTTINVLFGDHS